MTDLPDLDAVNDSSFRGRMTRWARKLVQSQYFMIALLVHMVIFVFLTKWIFQAAPETPIVTKGDFPKQGPIDLTKPVAIHPPKKELESTPVGLPKPIMHEPSSASDSRVITALTPTSEFIRPHVGANISPDSTPTLNQPNRIWVQNAGKYVKAGIVNSKGQPILPKNEGLSTDAHFSCYVAKYAGGDWDCNLGITADGRWYGNCLYNLSTQMNHWSKGKLVADVKPTVLDLSSRDWIEKVHPPFIFITGHKDFRFTAAEVENLQEYLIDGGVLWADNALAGRNSRFDVALRRELTRVTGESLTKLPPTHPIYTSCFKFKETPAGVNGSQESLEAILIKKKVCVLYTLNAYSDLWETSLTPRAEVDMQVDWSPTQKRYFTRVGPHWNGHGAGAQDRYNFYRNINPQSILNSYRLGMNIVIHLITRFNESASSSGERLDI